MIIRFLGTSAGWPLPRLGCKCKICTSPDPKDKRTRPAVLIDQKILIDAGPDIYWQLKNLDLSTFSTLVVTHAHFDHILGFWDLSHIYNLKKPLTLITTQEVLNGVKKIYNYPLTPRFVPQIILPLEVIEIDHLKITFFPVKHNRIPCFAVKLKGERLVIYAPDLRKVPKVHQKLCRDVHLLILGGSSLGKRGQAKGHESIEEGIKLAKNLRAKKVYFTHIGHITGRHEELKEYVKSHGEKDFHIAYDDLEVVV
jgi:phosphoribosyl 1,2-cyclic phosphate phosphodiesterase